MSINKKHDIVSECIQVIKEFKEERENQFNEVPVMVIKALPKLDGCFIPESGKEQRRERRKNKRK